MEMPEGKDVSGRASKVLLGWMRNPVVDRAMARRGLLEVSARCEVELGRDYAADVVALIKEGVCVVMRIQCGVTPAIVGGELLRNK